MWKDRRKHTPIDDRNYLVCWLKENDEYSQAHRAYYMEEEDQFFSLENHNSHPLVVDIFCEIPNPNEE